MIPPASTKRTALFPVSEMKKLPSALAKTELGLSRHANVAGPPSPHQLRKPLPKIVVKFAPRLSESMEWIQPLRLATKVPAAPPVGAIATSSPKPLFIAPRFTSDVGFRNAGEVLPLPEMNVFCPVAGS